MRVLIDEDTAVQLVEPLRHVLIGHEVDHIIGRNWSGKKDRNVLRDAKQARYQVIITRDRSQFDDPDECDVMKKSGLHHVRYGQRHQGAHCLALALSAIYRRDANGHTAAGGLQQSDARAHRSPGTRAPTALRDQGPEDGPAFRLLAAVPVT